VSPAAGISEGGAAGVVGGAVGDVVGCAEATDAIIEPRPRTMAVVRLRMWALYLGR